MGRCPRSGGSGRGCTWIRWLIVIERLVCPKVYDELGLLVVSQLPKFLMETGPEVHQSRTRLLLFGRPWGRYPLRAPRTTAPR